MSLVVNSEGQVSVFDASRAGERLSQNMVCMIAVCRGGSQDWHSIGRLSRDVRQHLDLCTLKAQTSFPNAKSVLQQICVAKRLPR